MVALTQSRRRYLVRLWHDCTTCLAKLDAVSASERIECVKILNYLTPLLISLNIDF